MTQIINPKNNAPQSPRKIEAGWKLCIKNPEAEPASNNDNAAISGLPKCKLFKEIVTNTIIEIPAHKPSNPSIKFNAFVIPIIQPYVIIIQNDTSYIPEN